ncbi:hypothetical protein RIF29_01897 [Crotalaria pallida]|uniref:Uncharacterized protein n=1 Tax=Crotalaria pallida TaxID=3830 RepID=A0AAN9P7L6_CROPI
MVNCLLGDGTNMASLAWEILWTETFLVMFLLPVANQEMLPVVGGIHCWWRINPFDMICPLASRWLHSFDRLLTSGHFISGM